METYKNDYTKEEDKMLWELHEIRHFLHDELKNKSIKEINQESFELLKKWKKRRKLARSST